MNFEFELDESDFVEDVNETQHVSASPTSFEGVIDVRDVLGAEDPLAGVLGR
jgi:hypothetical protein